MEHTGPLAIVGGHRFDRSTAMLLADNVSPGAASPHSATQLYRTALFGRYILVETPSGDGEEALRELTRDEAIEEWKKLPRHPAAFQEAFPGGNADVWQRLAASVPRASDDEVTILPRPVPEIRCVSGLQEPRIHPGPPERDPVEAEHVLTTADATPEPNVQLGESSLTTRARNAKQRGSPAHREPALPDRDSEPPGDGDHPRVAWIPTGSGGGAGDPGWTAAPGTDPARALWLDARGEWHMEGVVRHDDGFLRIAGDTLSSMRERRVGRLRRRRVMQLESWPLTAVVRVETQDGRGEPRVIIHVSEGGRARSIRANHCRPREEVARLLEILRQRPPGATHSNGRGPA